MNANINLTQKIKVLIEEIIGKELIDETHILDNGWLDSLQTINLVYRLEEEFNISIPVDEFSHENFNSIKSIERLVSLLTKE
jgi:acyl carrier protein